jgi:hypothetical protein
MFYSQASYVEFGYNAWSVVVLLTIPLGIFGFLRIRRRTGKTPPLRCYSPWIAIYLWYALIGAYPGTFAFLQIFHALQYLIFPLRVEVNQYSAKQKRTESKKLIHAVAYYVVLVIVGAVVLELPSLSYIWGDKNLSLHELAAGFVNLHHYFIDGVIWKIRNPQVRRDLFAHLNLA